MNHGAAAIQVLSVTRLHLVDLFWHAGRGSGSGIDRARFLTKPLRRSVETAPVKITVAVDAMRSSLFRAKDSRCLQILAKMHAAIGVAGGNEQWLSMSTPGHFPARSSCSVAI